MSHFTDCISVDLVTLINLLETWTLIPCLTPHYLITLCTLTLAVCLATRCHSYDAGIEERKRVAVRWLGARPNKRRSGQLKARAANYKLLIQSWAKLSSSLLFFYEIFYNIKIYYRSDVRSAKFIQYNVKSQFGSIKS